MHHVLRQNCVINSICENPVVNLHYILQWMASGLLGLLGVHVARHVTAAYGHEHAPALNQRPWMVVNHVQGTIQKQILAVYACAQVKKTQLSCPFRV